MIPAALLLLSAPPAEIVRGDYGEPHVFAQSVGDAFYGAGYAVAQDRLWQMEMSRRSARGRLAALVGKSAVASDQDAIRFGYTDAEYTAMWQRLSPRAQTIFQSYCDGVNAWIDEASANGKLPKGYESKPDKWQPVDSMAIAVNLVRLFGKGGAGEIRNLLLYTYLKDKLKDKTADAIEDLLWQNDSASITTVSNSDDPFKGKSPFPPSNRDTLRKHLALLPKANLLELLPGIRIEQQQDMIDLAAQLNVPNKWGSYAMVIGKERSALGVPLLLNGPQMGFGVPSIVHMLSITSPDYTAVGMDVPGIPGVLVGHTPSLAWGVTSGVADTDDVFFVNLNKDDASEYKAGASWTKFDRANTQIDVKGGQQATGTREMSGFGPVVIKSTSTGVAYVRKSALWQRELENLDVILQMPSASGIQQAQSLARKVSASFNLFVATAVGDIGWFYCARVPMRADNVDPRFPAPADAEHDWRGFVPPESMPYVINPKRGVIANWNNKPVSWWPNMDTPIWGRIFRNEAIVKRLDALAKIAPQDLEQTARGIATGTEDQRYFLPEMLAAVRGRTHSANEEQALSYLENWNGGRLEGSVAPVVYDAWFDALREEIFTEQLGTFLAPANFKLIVQATFTWNALHGKTNVSYLGKRKPADVYAASFTKAIDALQRRLGNEVSTWNYTPGYINWKGIGTVPYSDRGTYIQVVELWKQPFGRCVVPPGISESPDSAHFSDQKDLAAGWMFYPMLWRRDTLPR